MSLTDRLKDAVIAAANEENQDLKLLINKICRETLGIIEKISVIRNQCCLVIKSPDNSDTDQILIVDSVTLQEKLSNDPTHVHLHPNELIKIESISYNEDGGILGLQAIITDSLDSHDTPLPWQYEADSFQVNIKESVFSTLMDEENARKLLVRVQDEGKSVFEDFTASINTVYTVRLPISLRQDDRTDSERLIHVEGLGILLLYHDDNNEGLLILHEQDILTTPTLLITNDPEQQDADAIEEDHIIIDANLDIASLNLIQLTKVELSEENLSLQQRTAIRSRRAELLKQQRLHEFLADDSESTPTNVKSRFEKAKRKQQEEEQARLYAIRNNPSKQVTATSSVQVVREAYLSPSFSTPTAAAAVGLHDSSSQQVTPNKVTHKFLSSFHDHAASGAMMPTDAATGTNAAADFDNTVSPDGSNNNASKVLKTRSTSMRDMWTNVLQSSKSSEHNKYQTQKSQTISQFRLTDGSGIVKKRIDEWEELFVQIAISAEQLEEFMKIATSLSYRRDYTRDLSGSYLQDAQLAFGEGCLVPELIRINETRIFNIRLLTLTTQTQISKLVNDNRSAHVTLACGVYGEHDSKPPIDVFAVAFKTREEKIYLALTIKPAAGYTDDDPEVCGLRKVVVLARDMKGVLLEKLLMVVTANYKEDDGSGQHVLSPTVSASGEQAFYPTGSVDNQTEQDRVSGESRDDDDDYGEVEDLMSYPHTTTEAGEGEESVVIANDQLFAENGEQQMLPLLETINEGEIGSEEPSPLPITPSAADDEDEAGKKINVIFTEATIDTSDSYTQLAPVAANEETEGEKEEEAEAKQADEGTPASHATAINSFFTTADSTDDHEEGIKAMPMIDEDDGIDPTATVMDDTSPCHYTTDLSLANVSIPRSYPPTATTSNRKRVGKYAWPIEDEMDSDMLPKASHYVLFLSLREVITTSCLSNLFALQTAEGSLLFTGTLKQARTNTRYLAVQGRSTAAGSAGRSEGKVFEWIRGAALSGWLLKWPMQSQSFGRRRWRFFILRDHLLSYHSQRPTSEEEIQSTFTKNTLHLTENTTIEVGRKFLQKCLVITTPLDTLWIRVRNDFATEASRWMKEIHRAVENQSRMKLFTTIGRVESKWHHESQAFQLLAVDAALLSVSSRDASAEQSEEQQEKEEKYIKAALFCLRETVPQSAINMTGMRESFSYSIDLAISDSGRVQLPIMIEVGAAAVAGVESRQLPGYLTILKIYGDLLVLGGTGGLLALAVISRSSTAAASATGMNDLMSVSSDSFTSAINSPTRHSSGSSRKALFLLPFWPSPSISSSSASTGVYYPHSSTAAITAIGTAQRSSMLAAADSTGIISLWTVPRQPNTSLNPAMSIPRSALIKVAQQRMPRLLDRVDLHMLGASDSSAGERVTKLIFVEPVAAEGKEDAELQLFVCTTKRLLLLIIKAATGCLQKWMEVDRAMPDLCAIFDLSFDNLVGEEREEHTSNTWRMIQWRVLEVEEPTVIAGKGLTSNSSTPLQMERKCNVSRLEWTMEMFQTALLKLKQMPEGSTMMVAQHKRVEGKEEG